MGGSRESGLVIRNSSHPHNNSITSILLFVYDCPALFTLVRPPSPRKARLQRADLGLPARSRRYQEGAAENAGAARSV